MTHFSVFGPEWCCVLHTQGYTEIVPKPCGMYTDPVFTQSVWGFSDECNELTGPHVCMRFKSVLIGQEVTWLIHEGLFKGFPVSSRDSGHVRSRWWRGGEEREGGFSYDVSNVVCSAQNASHKQLFTIKWQNVFKGCLLLLNAAVFGGKKIKGFRL